MRKLSLIFILLIPLSVYAARPQTRAVIIDTICNAQVETMLQSVEKYCYQFQACPDSLFKWAYLGLEEELNPKKKRTEESRDAIQLRYKDRIYDPTHKIGDVAIDVYILGVRWWKDQHLITNYTCTYPTPASIDTILENAYLETSPRDIAHGSSSPQIAYPVTCRLHAAYSGSVLEVGEIIFTFEPINEIQTRVYYEFSLTFGKFLSSFISDKTWRNAIEWRFEMILDNIIEYAETGTVIPKTHESRE